jgi:hypothetical protein
LEGDVGMSGIVLLVAEGAHHGEFIAMCEKRCTWQFSSQEYLKSFNHLMRRWAVRLLLNGRAGVKDAVRDVLSSTRRCEMASPVRITAGPSTQEHVKANEAKTRDGRVA